MFKKILTHLIILMLTVLPVQVINAGVEYSSMQLSMEKTDSIQKECMHASMVKSDKPLEMSCCDDSSHQCDNCGTCPHISSAIFLPGINLSKTYSLTSQKFIISYSLLNGVPQKNLLRPPRTSV